MFEHLEGLNPKQTSVAVDIHVCYIQTVFYLQLEILLNKKFWMLNCDMYMRLTMSLKVAQT